jgi:hypothetical protein
MKLVTKKAFLVVYSILLVVAVSAQNDTGVKSRTIQEGSLGITLSGGNNPLYGGNFKYNFTKDNSRYSYGLNSSGTLNWVSATNKTTLTREEGDLMVYGYKDSKEKVHLLAFGEIQHSLMRLIAQRLDAGIGPSIHLEPKNTYLSLSECLLVESTDRRGKYRSNYTVFRASTRMHLIYKTPAGTFSTITMLQPAIYSPNGENLEDFLILRSSNKFDITSTSKLSLGIGIDVNYEKFSEFIGVKALDWGTNVTFTYKINK